jgi:hypothetical protein
MPEGPWTITEEKAEIEAWKLPLPELTQDEKIRLATEWVERTAKSVACTILGLSSNSLKKSWRAELKHQRERRRFCVWMNIRGAHWDKQRVAFVCLSPFRNP